MNPDTTHGKELFEMFCFDYDRPNCLGKDMAARHVMDHAEKFMKVYGNHESGAAQPWAAFLSFVDSHEDTSTLISYLDELFVNFLQKIDLASTIVIFTSDHGLHYGPSFLSNGERERSEPILYLHVPEKLKASINLADNQDLFTTPFDVYETILDGTALHNTKSSEVGTSLLKKLPDSRKSCWSTPGIPTRFCELFSGQSVVKDGLQLYPRKNQEKCNFMPTVPSVLSFYADIPRGNRPSFPECKSKHSKDMTSDKCVCATKRHNVTGNWFPCTSKTKNEEHTADLLIRKCSHETLPFGTVEVDINIVRNETLVDQQIKKLPKMLKQSGKIDSLPNILFIEVDSVSRSAALRHLPKTMKVLQSHPIIYNDTEKIYSCPSGFCGAIFNKTSVVGQQSIPNQLATLSGCLNEPYLDIENKRKGHRDGKNVFCTRENENPWLFEVTENLGYINFFAEEFCYEGSPYIIQENYFPDTFHYKMNDLFCQLSEQKLDGKMLYQMEADLSTNPQPCVAGRSRQEFAFEYIRGIWNAYPDIPKLAFLNSIAAHDYSVDIAYQPLGLEAYDDYLAGFIDEMLRRPDAEKTIIILRSDHGIQGGPLPIDFSSQVEHLNPFNNMIIPQKFHGLSLESLFSNQDKLVTGFDLYKTLRRIIMPSILDDSSFRDANEKENKILPWAHNLLQDIIPNGRNCLNARNPKYCPCLGERVDLMPYFYVGHSEYPGQLKKGTLKYDDKKGLYKAVAYPGKNEIILPPNLATASESGSSNLIPDASAALMNEYHCNAIENNTATENNNVRNLWNELDSIAASYKGSSISGGIFLYPRQTQLLTKVIDNLIHLKNEHRHDERNFLQICETGFGAGHSASFFLAISNKTKVITFDKFDRPYQLPILEKLKNMYPDRLHHIQGNSCESVPHFFTEPSNKKYDAFQGCDLIHGSSLCQRDNVDLVTYSSKFGGSSILTSTAMNSLTGNDVYFGEKGQWQRLKSNGCISDIACFSDVSATLNRTYIFAQKGESISPKFCFARVTGKCDHRSIINRDSYERNNNTKSMSNKISNILLNDICPKLRIEYLPQ